MKKFVLINICENKKIREYTSDSNWKHIKLLPYYNDTYICFSINKDYSFAELMDMFIFGNTSEQIGSISIIAEKYPMDLYGNLLDNIHLFPRKQIEFLFNRVIGSYLPLIVPQNKLLEYDFGDNYSTDIWVNIFLLIKANLKKRNSCGN